MAIKTFRLLVLLLLSLTLPAQAQFLGQVAPQTSTQQVFSAINSAQCSAVLRNVGQSSHVIFYSLTGVAGNVSQLRISIEGSFDGTAFFKISDEARQTGSTTGNLEGAVFGNGYYPAVRVCLDTFTIDGGSPTISTWYSGTSVSIPNRTGIFSNSNTNTQVIAFNQDMSVNISVEFAPSTGSTAGTVFFCSDTAPASRAYDIKLQVVPFSSANQFFTFGNAYEYTVFPDGFGCQPFVVPATGADWIAVQISSNPTPAAAVQIYRLIYVLGETHTPSGVSVELPPQSATGTTSPIASALAQPADTGAGESTNSTQPLVITKHTVHLQVTGGPATCSYRLEGAMDTAEASFEWFDISGPLACTASTLVHIVDKPVMAVRGNLTDLTGGSSPTVTLRYLGVQ